MVRSILFLVPIAALIALGFVPALPMASAGLVDISVGVFTEKTVFEPGETVNVTEVVTNTGDKAVTLGFRGPQGFYVVTDCGGKLVYDLLNHSVWVMWITYITIQPGDSHTFQFKDRLAWPQTDDSEKPVLPDYYLIWGELALLGHETGYQRIPKCIAVGSLEDPVASFSISNASPVSGTVVTFDGSASVNGFGLSQGLSYAWDWDGDSVPDTNWSPNPVATHSFEKAGKYDVTLAVKDPLGIQTTATLELYVSSVVPELSVLWPAVLAAALIVIILKRKAKALRME